MKASLSITLASIGLAGVVLAGCAGEPKWQKAGATESDIKRDKYWCTKVTQEKFHKSGNPAISGERVKTVKLDHDCMKARGYSIVTEK